LVFEREEKEQGNARELIMNLRTKGKVSWEVTHETFHRITRE